MNFISAYQLTHGLIGSLLADFFQRWKTPTLPYWAPTSQKALTESSFQVRSSGACRVATQKLQRTAATWMFFWHKIGLEFPTWLTPTKECQWSLLKTKVWDLRWQRAIHRGGTSKARPDNIGPCSRRGTAVLPSAVHAGVAWTSAAEPAEAGKLWSLLRLDGLGIT